MTERPRRFRKRSIVEAVQLTDAIIIAHVLDKAPLPDGVRLYRASYNEATRAIHEAVCVVDTLEGVMRAEPGDWIITGVKGERYPCKADIFAESYEEVVYAD